MGCVERTRGLFTWLGTGLPLVVVGCADTESRSEVESRAPIDSSGASAPPAANSGARDAGAAHTPNDGTAAERDARGTLNGDAGSLADAGGPLLDASEPVLPDAESVPTGRDAATLEGDGGPPPGLDAGRDGSTGTPEDAGVSTGPDYTFGDECVEIFRFDPGLYTLGEVTAVELVGDPPLGWYAGQGVALHKQSDGTYGARLALDRTNLEYKWLVTHATDAGEEATYLTDLSYCAKIWDKLEDWNSLRYACEMPRCDCAVEVTFDPQRAGCGAVQSVSLASDENGWSRTAFMTRGADGVYRLTLNFTGVRQYKFAVTDTQGNVRWLADDGNCDPNGDRNSVLEGCLPR